jgi:DNA-binding transcriptional regulator YiaG
MLEATPSTINNWEKGRSAPTLQALPRLIAFLGYDPAVERGVTEIARLRRSLGLTQEAFAAEMHVDPSTLARWECGETTPAPSHRARITALTRRDKAG